MTVQDSSTVPTRYRLRIEDYLLLDSTRAFAGGRTELIEGDVILMSPQYRPHMFVKDELAFALRLALRDIGSALHAGTEGSVALPPHDLPQPDIILTSEPRGEGPIPRESVAMLIEIADATLHDDLTLKAALYARQGIPEYWVADVNARVIHQMWVPEADSYMERREVAFGERMVAATVDGLVVETVSII